MSLDLSQWPPQGHLVYFIWDVDGQWDLSRIYAAYDGSNGGYSAHHPELMVPFSIQRIQTTDGGLEFFALEVQKGLWSGE